MEKALIGKEIALFFFPHKLKFIELFTINVITSFGYINFL